MTATQDLPSPTTADGRAPERRSPSPLGVTPATLRFWVPVAVIALLGLGLRLAVIQAVPTCADFQTSADGCLSVSTDSGEYLLGAEYLAAGNGYVLLHNVESESAHHPPAFVTYLGLWYRAGVESPEGLRRTTAVLSLLTVALMASVARSVGGRHAGWVAAGFGALYPALWVNDVVLMSESLYQVLAALVLVAGYQMWRRRSLLSAVGLGVAVGLAALTRSEGALLGPLIAFPLAIGMVEISRWRRLAMVVMVGAVSAALVAPWVLLNLSRFERPVTMTTTTGQSLFLTNQPDTYYGERLGSKSGYPLLLGSSARAKIDDADESDVDTRLRAEATEFQRENVGRLPVVVAARVGRVWGLYETQSMVRDDHLVEGRLKTPSRLVWWAHYLGLPLAAAGVVVLWRRGLPISPLMALVATATFTAAVNFGLTRYRAGADVALCVAASVALVSLARAALGRSRPTRGARPTSG